jgi:hypothetical protein
MSTQQYRQDGLPLPPYGLMTDGFQFNLEHGPDIPPDLCVCPEGSPEERRKWWTNWMQVTRGILASVLWPEWDQNSQAWSGSSASWMYSLTADELKLIDYLWKNTLQTKPMSPVLGPNCPAHIMFFRSEDISQWFSMYNFYDSTLPSGLIDTFGQVLETRKLGKYGTTHLQIKTLFQRPRAFQTAFLLKNPPLRPLQAISAGSPSFCSGHALQALMGIGAVMEFVLLNGVKLSPASWSALRQFAVDIGDRRVMAAVHYPGDNLASWIIAMRLANHVFRTNGVKIHLWQAISRQSVIYPLLADHRIYDKALAALHEASTDVEKTVLEGLLPG